jgi:transcriptional regulator with XRE-family HTH domain
MRTLGRTVALEMALQDRARGQRIAQIREQRAHLTQQELAQAMGIALRTVQKWEAGYGLQASNKRALADALGVMIEEIMGETEPVHPLSVMQEIDARVEEFRRFSFEMQDAFAEVVDKLDRQYGMLSRILEALGTPEIAAELHEAADLFQQLAREPHATRAEASRARGGTHRRRAS